MGSMSKITVEIVFGLLLRMAVPLLRVGKMFLFGLLKLGKFGKLRGSFNGPNGLCLHDLDHISISAYHIFKYIQI